LVNVRSGPLEIDDSLTTIIIVINKITVINISAYELCRLNSLMSSWLNEIWSVGLSRFDEINMVRIKIIVIVNKIFLDDVNFWFGDVAVKYANITSIPPT